MWTVTQFNQNDEVTGRTIYVKRLWLARLIAWLFSGPGFGGQSHYVLIDYVE